MAKFLERCSSYPPQSSLSVSAAGKNSEGIFLPIGKEAHSSSEFQGIDQ